MTLNISILKIILSFKIRQISTVCIMTTTGAQKQRKIGKYPIKDKHKNKNILKGHKDSMKGEMQ